VIETEARFIKKHFLLMPPPDVGGFAYVAFTPAG
jgi:hypothetical protein